MMALRRHQLVRLTPMAWSRVLAQHSTHDARPCLEHWAAGGLPLVIARQSAGQGEQALCLGLPAPAHWGRQRLSLQVRRSDVIHFDHFPGPREIVKLLPPASRAAWLALCYALAAQEVRTRVYGSFGWQILTGLSYVREQSDLDLLLLVDDAAAADAVVAMLDRSGFNAPRLDGELGFVNGSDVAWREWRAWRARRVEKILVKRVHGVSLESGTSWQAETIGPGQAA